MGDESTNGAAVTAGPPPTHRRRFQLIDTWHLAPRMWSVRLKAAGALLQGWFLVWPEFALNLWNMMPSQVTDRLPARTVLVLPLVLFIASGLAQFMKQEKLHGRG